LAFFILQSERKGERKYEIDTTGFDQLKKLRKAGASISHATIYMPVSYYLLSKAFRHLPLTTRNNFVDIGSGKGRALCVAANKGFKKVTGVEFSGKMCDAARINLVHTKKRLPLLQYTVHNVDAVDFVIPDDTDCIFFFNPFDDIIMAQVVDNIKISLEKIPRDMAVIYANPLYNDLLFTIGFSEKYYSCEMDFLEVSILSNRKRSSDFKES
jgi:SAM-dependent methyltransferase